MLCVKRAASVALPSVFLMDTLLRCLYLVREKRCLVRTDFLPTGAEFSIRMQSFRVVLYCLNGCEPACVNLHGTDGLLYFMKGTDFKWAMVAPGCRRDILSGESSHTCWRVMEQRSEPQFRKRGCLGTASLQTGGVYGALPGMPHSQGFWGVKALPQGAWAGDPPALLSVDPVLWAGGKGFWACRTFSSSHLPCLLSLPT